MVYITVWLAQRANTISIFIPLLLLRQMEKLLVCVRKAVNALGFMMAASSVHGAPESQHVICTTESNTVIQFSGERIEVRDNTILVFGPGDKVQLIANLTCWTEDQQITAPITQGVIKENENIKQ